MAVSVWLAFGMASAYQASAESTRNRLYQIIFLKRDPARKPISKGEGDRIQAAHMANIQTMADRGLLVAAGPFDDTPSVISGVFFFAAPTIEAARSLAIADPTGIEHRNTVEVLAWRGPVGIGDEYKRLHKERPETPVGMGVHPFVILRKAGQDLNPKLMERRRAYWASLRSSGKVVTAGAVERDNSALEIIIFQRIPDSEAALLAAADPAVSLGVLTVEAHRWWCAANVFPN